MPSWSPNSIDIVAPVTHVKFETGSAELKQLESKVYVGSGRFILEKDMPVIVEYKISELTL